MWGREPFDGPPAPPTRAGATTLVGVAAPVRPARPQQPRPSSSVDSAFERARRRSTGRGRRYVGDTRTRWTTVALKALIAFLAFCILGAGAGFFYIRYQFSRIERVDIPQLVDEVPGKPINVLLVGSDTRDGTEGELAEATGRDDPSTAGRRSDTMMVLHIDPGPRKAMILSIPRDLWVPISGEGYSAKINTAYAVGGAPMLVDTIRSALGIEINHYVEVDFVGFQNIVNTVGGVDMYFASPARDLKSGLNVANEGCVTLDGFQSLGFVRSRFYESFEAGRWQAEGGNDFQRIERQQDFIRRMISKASGVRNPFKLNELVNIGVNNVTLDQGMALGDILKLAERFRSFDADAVDMFTIPATAATIRGQSALELDVEEAQVYIDRINGIDPPAADRPADVRARVLNGNGIGGAAADASTDLQGLGFRVAGAADADRHDYGRSLVRFGPGDDGAARLLASYLVNGADLVPDASLATGTVDVVLVVGADYAGVRAVPAAEGEVPIGTPPINAGEPTGAEPSGAPVGAPKC